jgi:hypothetical protein
MVILSKRRLLFHDASQDNFPAASIQANDPAAIFPQINPKNRYLHGFFPFDV